MEGPARWMPPAVAGGRTGGRLLLDGAGGEAGGVIIEKEYVQDHDGHRGQHRARHERAPEVDVPANQLGRDPHTPGDLLPGGREGGRADEPAPRERESE